MTTRAKVLAAARRRWGKGAFVEINRLAPSPEQRAKNREMRREITQSIRAIEEALPPSRNRDLLVAARFAVDVNGDSPSLDDLREVVEYVERRLEAIEERNDLREERDRLDGHSTKYTAGKENGVFGTIMARGDTLAELLESIESKANSRADLR